MLRKRYPILWSTRKKLEITCFDDVIISLYSNYFERDIIYQSQGGSLFFTGIEFDSQSYQQHLTGSNTWFLCKKWASVASGIVDWKTKNRNNNFWSWIGILFLIRIWFSEGPVSPIYSITSHPYMNQVLLCSYQFFP